MDAAVVLMGELIGRHQCGPAGRRKRALGMAESRCSSCEIGRGALSHLPHNLAISRDGRSETAAKTTALRETEPECLSARPSVHLGATSGTRGSLLLFLDPPCRRRLLSHLALPTRIAIPQA